MADLERKLIVRAEVTIASEHDRQALDSLTRPGDPETWADSADTGANCQAIYLRARGSPHTSARTARADMS